MTGGKILGRTDIHDNGLILVDQRGQLRRAQAAATAAHFMSDQQRQQDDEGTREQVVGSGKCNQVINHQGGSRALKWR
ncbi:hypothetical protein SDC9_204240 [bioreactor metagenome]|uniref:Uncharacterized protein n=1 Tax=bioreactor metagenome TaxID=1076179 RepID=A0A645J059_9ZZZZ